MGTTIDAGPYEVLPRSAEPADDGRPTIGGCAVADLAAEFGTPALVFDERGLRDTAREYLAAFHERHEDTEVHFASKALPCAPVLRILAEEGLGCDVASAGELAIALAAGVDPAEVLLHGNAKPVTGACCYSLMNNYNGARRSPVVLVGDGEARLAVRREQMSDLLARNVL